MFTLLPETAVNFILCISSYTVPFIFLRCTWTFLEVFSSIKPYHSLRSKECIGRGGTTSLPSPTLCTLPQILDSVEHILPLCKYALMGKNKIRGEGEWPPPPLLPSLIGKKSLVDVWIVSKICPTIGLFDC